MAYTSHVGHVSLNGVASPLRVSSQNKSSMFSLSSKNFSINECSSVNYSLSLKSERTYGVSSKNLNCKKLFHHFKNKKLIRFAVERDDRPATENENTSLENPPAWFDSSLNEQPFDNEPSPIQKWLYPSKAELPDDVEMTIWDHLEELRERILISVGIVGIAILGCFCFSKDLVTLLEAPVYSQGVRFLQLSPGEFFFTTLKVAGYSGLLIGSPVILYEIIAFVVPGLTLSERRFLGPIVFGSSILFYAGLFFSYKVLTPAALNFFISYADGVVESLWSIDQYFEFVFVLMLSTGLSFQVPVIQLLLGQLGLVSGQKMLSVWRYVVVGAVVAAAILTPSTDPLTQLLLAGPLIGLYMGGAYAVLLTEAVKQQPEQ